ncbi:MAG: ABC transporter ATP-binding protein [Clostridia bacterium]|nr:ABC transporter ATP-binding protein [Clostridia bacterium]
MQGKEKKGVLLDHISKVYIDPKTNNSFYAVNDITLDIQPGEFITLLGPSGCGKTTTLRMVAGFESPDEGEIYLGGEPINAKTPDKRDTAMMFQNYALFPHMNVFDNVAFGLKLRKLSRDEIRQRVFDILDLVELTGMENRLTNQLSGGQQQRVALARALVVQPSVLLFDEPLSNLDANLRVQMRTEIRRIQQEVGSTAIYVTHDQSEAMSISDRIVVMNKGIIAQMDTPEHIYYRPASKFVASFIGEANYLKGNVVSHTGEKSEIEIMGRRIEAFDSQAERADKQAELMLRPESVYLADQGLLPCRVILSCFMGAYQNYHVMVGDDLVKITDYNPRRKKIYNVGDEAFLCFDPEDGTIL